MAIWSLTQERVEKLLKQIAEKQAEIDTLIKLSPKDIWEVDLEAFMTEWNIQLDEEGKRKKKIASITRRASQKLGHAKGAKGKKKRKMDGDDSDDSGSDFGPVKKKVKPKKEGLLSYLQQEPKKPTAAEALKSSSAFGSTAPQKQGTLLTHLVKKKEETPQTDGASDSRPASRDSAAAPAPAPKRGRPAAAKAVKKPAPKIESDDDDSDVFAAVAKEAVKEPSKAIASRAPRSATKQAPKYNLGSDSDDDDDLLGDVSAMVKSVGTGTNGVPMFKTTTTSARPGSNSNARPAPAKKSSPIEIDDDTTNFEDMPQPSPKRPAPSKVIDDIMSSDEDDSDIVIKKPAAKPAPKPKAAAAKPAPKPKAVVAKKPVAQSPAAKAYAKKHGKDAAVAAPKAKKQNTIDSDDDMEDADAIANDLLSDEDDAEEPTPKPKAAAARPGRRAAATKPAKYVVSDDEAESEVSEPSFEDEDSD
jgi:DNA topoisomerase-2